MQYSPVLKSFLFFLLVAFLWGCEDETPILEPVYRASVVGTIDGEPWEAFAAQVIFTLNTIEFTALGLDSSAIIFVIQDQGVGTYTLPDEIGEYASYLEDSSTTDEFLVNAQNGSGEIDILENDEENNLLFGRIDLVLVRPSDNKEVSIKCNFENIPISR